MVIQNNIPSLNSGRNLKKNQNALNKNLEKLSSGFRINRSGDDAAGLAISESMRSLINATNQAENNVLDGIGLIHTAEGAMQELHSMMNRAYELSVAAANGTYNVKNRKVIQQEIDELAAEMKRVVDYTEFNGIPVLKGAITGSGGNVTGKLPAWIIPDASMAIGRFNSIYTTTETYTDSTGKKTNYTINHQSASLDFSAFNGSASMKATLKDTAFHATCYSCNNYYRIMFTDGTTSSSVKTGNNYTFNIGIDGLNTAEDLVDAIISATDNGHPNKHYTKYAKDPTDPGKLHIFDDRSMNNSPVSDEDEGNWDSWDNPLFNYSTANCHDYGFFGQGYSTQSGDSSGALHLQIGPSKDERLDMYLPELNLDNMGILGVSVLNGKRASLSIHRMKDAINFLSSERGRMGAYENRLEHAGKTLAINKENLTAAESRIRDTNMANEYTQFTKNNILLLAAQSMLAQANTSPQSALRLIQA